VLRAPEQITHALAAAAERRRDLRGEMIKGEITVSRYRELVAFEDRWINTLLDELLAARASAS
jgi:hypothetical protein